MVSSALADFPTISFFLTEPKLELSSMHCPLLAHAIASWRQAQVCLRPLSSFGEDRTSRPPPLQHRVPIRATSTRSLGFCDVSLIRITPGLFQSQVEQS